MGKVVSAIFGGGDSSPPPLPPPPPPPPPPADTAGANEAMDARARAEKSRKMASGRASTMLSDQTGLGSSGSSDSTMSAKKMLLGS